MNNTIRWAIGIAAVAVLWSGPVQGEAIESAGSGYWTNPAAKLPATADEFFNGAEQHPGSWWTDWQAWLMAQDSSKVPARDPLNGKFKVLEDAPGSFVKARLDAKKKAA